MDTEGAAYVTMPNSAEDMQHIYYFARSVRTISSIAYIIFKINSMHPPVLAVNIYNTASILITQPCFPIPTDAPPAPLEGIFVILSAS